MFQTPRKLVGAFVLCAAIVSYGSAGEKLRYHMSKGATYKYAMARDSKTAAQMMGQEFKSTSVGTMNISLTVEDIGKEGELTCTATLDAAKFSVDSPQMKDTALVPTQFLGKRASVTFSSLGKTQSIVPIDSLPQLPPMSPLSGFNPTDLFQRILLELPDQEVSVGDTWKVTRPDTVTRMTLKIVSKPNTEFKVVGTEKVGVYDCLKISIEGTSSQYGAGSMQGMEIVVDGTTKSKGYAYFAPKEGVLVAVEQSSDTEMTTTGTGEQMFTQTSTTNQKTTASLVQ